MVDKAHDRATWAAPYPLRARNNDEKGDDNEEDHHDRTHEHSEPRHALPPIALRRHGQVSLLCDRDLAALSQNKEIVRGRLDDVQTFGESHGIRRALDHENLCLTSKILRRLAKSVLADPFRPEPTQAHCPSLRRFKITYASDAHLPPFGCRAPTST